MRHTISIHALGHTTDVRPDQIHAVAEMTRNDVMRALLKQHTRARRVAWLQAKQTTPLSWLRGVWERTR